MSDDLTAEIRAVADAATRVFEDETSALHQRTELIAAGLGDMFELLEAVDNVLIAFAMGWDMEGVIERLRAAKARVDANGAE
jgi:high-affinity nickel permease